jgi:hypothetical protein
MNTALSFAGLLLSKNNFLNSMQSRYNGLLLDFAANYNASCYYRYEVTCAKAILATKLFTRGLSTHLQLNNHQIKC